MAARTPLTEHRRVHVILILDARCFEQRYANPFNPETAITYALPQPPEVGIRIFDMLVQMVRTLDQDFQEAGLYRIQWDSKNQGGTQVGTGIYRS